MTLPKGIKVVLDTTKIYTDVPEDELHKARLKYATAVLMLHESTNVSTVNFEAENLKSVINLLEIVLRMVPEFIDASCLLQEVWNKYLKNGSPYSEYLDSHAWKIKRAQVLNRDENKCVGCKKEASEVHHRTYDNIGKEPLSDLVSLCGSCHDRIHSDIEVPTHWNPPNYFGSCDVSGHWFPDDYQNNQKPPKH